VPQLYVKGEFVGGFDGEGSLVGIPLDYALQDILGFPKEPDNVPNEIFSNTETITINDFAAASPYPSTIAVSDLPAPITSLTVTLHDLSHPRPPDISVLLVGPTGINVLLMAATGVNVPVSNINLRFMDGAPAIPDSDELTTGTYAPTGSTIVPFDAPAPGLPYGNMLSAFNGTDGSGTWELYVKDFGFGAAGRIAGGWSLDIVAGDGGWDVTVAKCNNTCNTAGNGICETDTSICTSGQFIGDSCSSLSDCVPQCVPFDQFLFCNGGPNAGDFCTTAADCPPSVAGVCEQVCASETDCADCGPNIVTTHVFSDPTRGDSDFDGLPDLLEQTIGSNPNDVDTDGDGLLDFDEFANFGQFFQNNFLFRGFFLTDAGSQQIGTSVTSQDTDGDGLSDTFERLDSWTVVSQIAGQPVTTIEVRSNPLLADSDSDGLSDLQEFFGRDNIGPGRPGDSGDATDPTNPDTDGDGQFDGDEILSDPLVPDLTARITVGAMSLNSTGSNWEITITAEVVGGSVVTIADRNLFLSCGIGSDVSCTDSFNYVPVFTIIDLGNQCGANQSIVLRSDETLVVRTRIANRSCPGGATTIHCISDAIEVYDFSEIQSSGFILREINVDARGVPGFSACGGDFRLEVTRE